MILDLLKPLFSSKTRINILRTFFKNPTQEMYIREITRATGEQINSIRRELESLEAIGLFSSKSKAGKKYFKINTAFIFYADFYSLFQKVNTPAFEITEALKKMSKKIDLIVLTGKFVEISEEDVPVDLFVVGDIQKEKIDKYLQTREGNKVRFALLSRADFLHRVKQKDHVLKHIFSFSQNIIPLNRVPELM